MRYPIETDDLLRKRFDDLQKKCQSGSIEAFANLAFSGARCAELLTEQLVSKDSIAGKAAVEKASEIAKAWPISYPALDDGRNNRIAEQLPAGLKQSLGIRRNQLRATGRHLEDHPEVNTFLEHALIFENTDDTDHELSSIMGALIVLHRECIKGNSHAASTVAMFGVQISELLEDLRQCPRGSKIGKALREAAMEASEWPVCLRNNPDLTTLSKRVPRCLGQNMGFRISKKPGTLADRQFSPEGRLGFAFGYYRDLHRARYFARKYNSYAVALFFELARQGRAAHRVLFDEHYRSARPHVGHKVFSQLPKDLWYHAGNPISSAPSNIRDLVAITKRLIGVVPNGTGPIWNKLRELPDFSTETIDIWVETSVLLAGIRCKQRWASGTWPQGILSAAEKRSIQTGASSSDYLIEETVRLWMKQGFRGLGRV